MRKHSRTLALLLSAIATPLICSADPLNGGLGNAFEILFAIIIAGVVITVAALVASIRSFKRDSKPSAGVWVLVAISKIIALTFAYALGPLSSAFGPLGIMADLSIVLLLVAYERHVTGSRFMVCYVLHAILSTHIIFNVFMFAAGMAGFYNAVLFIIMRVFIIILPATWYSYKLLQLSAVKQVNLLGQVRPILLGFLICFSTYLAISFPPYSLRSNTVSIFEHPELLRFMLVGVFPYNIIMLTSFLLPGIIAYQLHKSRSQA